MLTKIVALLAMVTPVLLQGCAGPLSPDEKIEGIVRILMHEPGSFTIFVQESATAPLVERQVRTGCRGRVEYVPDVARGQSMWLMMHSGPGGDLECYSTNLTLHIHSVEDINGAGWNHGKLGSGQTDVVQ